MRKDSKLLINEPPLQVLPTLATKIGLNEAIILEQVQYWLVIAEKAKDDRKYKDGRWWVYNTYQEWQENFPWWSLPTIKRTILSLEEAGYLVSKEMNAQDWDHTKWYSVDYHKLDGITDCIKMIPSKGSDEANQSDQDESLLIESETTTKTTSLSRGRLKEIKESANKTVDYILENQKKVKYQNRDKLPEPYLLFADLYNQVTGQEPTKRVLRTGYRHLRSGSKKPCNPNISALPGNMPAALVVSRWAVLVP